MSKIWKFRPVCQDDNVLKWQNNDKKIDRDKYIVEKVNFGVLCRTVHRPWHAVVTATQLEYLVGSYGEKTEFAVELLT